MDVIYWSIIFMGLGLLIVMLELFIPSAGILTVLAGACFIASIVAGFFSSLTAGLVMLLLIVILLPLLLMAMIKVWPKTPIGRRILIEPSGSPDAVVPEWEPGIHELVGQLGTARTKMLPSGIVLINGKKYDALSDGLPIDEGQPIRVVAVKNNRIIVVPHEGDLDDSEDLPARDRELLERPLEELGLDGSDAKFEDL